MKNLVTKLLRRTIYEIKHLCFYLCYVLGKACRTILKIECKTKIKQVTGNDIFFQERGIHNIDNEFKKEIQVAADKALNNELYVLHEYHDNVYDEEKGCYKWLDDYVTGYRYSKCYYKRVNSYYSSQGTDIKRVWELSRLQYLFAPALQWRISNEGKYAEYVIAVVCNWIDINTYKEGPNWKNAMEVAIRAINILLVTQLINGYQEYTVAIKQKVVESLYQHLKYIMTNLENYAGRTYNHYLADILGMLAISLSYPHFKLSKKAKDFAVTALEQEIQKQVLPDGGIFEGTSCYHCLSGEILALAAIFCKNAGVHLSKAYYEKISAIADFSLALRKNNGLMPQIGDNDSGRVIQLIPMDPLDYDSHIKMIKEGINVSFINYFRNNNTFYPVHTLRQCFKYSNIAIYRSKYLYCLLSATEAQNVGLGTHTHNDKQALELSIMDMDFFVDPGSGVYTSDYVVHNTFRSVCNHSTLNIDSYEQNKSQTSGIFGNSHDAKSSVSIESNDGIDLIGYTEVKSSDVAYSHERRVQIINDNYLCIYDEIITNCGKQINFRFVLHPDVTIELLGENVNLRNGNVEINVFCDGANPTTQNGYYSRSYDHYKPCQILLYTKKILSGTTSNIFKIHVSSNQ